MKLQDMVETHGIRFKKNLGQNLLLDDNINRIMVDAAALGPEDDVVEVGAGLGALTERLRRGARRVLAIEIDTTFMPVLEERFAGAGNVILFRGDVLNHELDHLVAEFLPEPGTLKMVSNLPYYITTPILFHFWEEPVFFERMVIMVQEEVALRMTAAPGCSDYGVLTLATQLRADADIVHKVPSTCFRPRPKVDSCIVRLRNRTEPRYPGLDDTRILKLVRAAFRQRRKTLRNSLAKSGETGLPAEAALEALEAAGINPGLRPERLALDDFARLERELASRRG